MLAHFRVAASRALTRSFTSTSILARNTGSVKFYDTKKGFGFIAPDEEHSHDGDLFFHATSMRGAEMGRYHVIPDETRVEFEIGEDSRGIRAVDVSLLGGDECDVDHDFDPFTSGKRRQNDGW